MTQEKINAARHELAHALMAELCVFAGLLGLDEDFLRASLLSTVGASDAPPRLGARREPLTKPTRLYQRRS